MRGIQYACGTLAFIASLYLLAQLGVEGEMNPANLKTFYVGLVGCALMQLAIFIEIAMVVKNNRSFALLNQLEALKENLPGSGMKLKSSEKKLTPQKNRGSGKRFSQVYREAGIGAVGDMI